MTFVQLALRVMFGIPTPAELVGDRFAPLIPVRTFGELITLAAGYNGLKRLGIGSVLVGQLVAGGLGGAVYALLLIRDRARVRGDRPLGRLTGRRFLVAFVVVLWLIAVVTLWPNLGTSAIGLPDAPARAATMIGLLIAFGLYAALVAFAAFERAERTHRRAAIDGASPVAPQSTRRGGEGGRLLRRRTVLLGGVAATAALGSAELLRRLSDSATFSYDGLQVQGPDISPITPNDRFYVVTKNVVDPDVQAQLWGLEISGAVDRPTVLSLNELMALPAVDQETTLMCISNPLGGGLMSNAVWTGVPLPVLLSAAGVRSNAVEVVCRSVDGYSDTFAVAKALEPTTLVAYRMNGQPLPRRHGYPVRLLVPGLYGEKSVKWLSRVEVADREVAGFYETQGWGPDFQIPTRSRFTRPDLRNPLSVGQTVLLGGTAFAGDRGVQRVEVTVDGGVTWQPARLDYPGSRLSWALWSYEWHATTAGDIRLAVRATDGTGAVQPADPRPIVPEGARGHHVVTARVSG